MILGLDAYNVGNIDSDFSITVDNGENTDKIYTLCEVKGLDSCNIYDVLFSIHSLMTGESKSLSDNDNKSSIYISLSIDKSTYIYRLTMKGSLVLSESLSKLIDNREYNVFKSGKNESPLLSSKVFIESSLDVKNVFNYLSNMLFVRVNNKMKLYPNECIVKEFFTDSGEGSGCRSFVKHILRSCDFNVEGFIFNESKIDYIKYKYGYIPLEDESSGFKVILSLSSYMWYATKYNKVLVVDDLDSYLHPLLVRWIDNTYRENKREIIYTIKNRHIIDNMIVFPCRFFYSEDAMKGISYEII